MLNARIEILRKLAWEYREIAAQDKYKANEGLHRAVNDLRIVRPVVLIEELPWHEMDFDGSLTAVNEEPSLRAVEIHLRKMLYRHKHFPADMLVPGHVSVPKVVRSTSIGVEIEERTLKDNEANNISAHEYIDQLAEESSLYGLHPSVITYDKETTMRNLQVIGDAIGDILPVRLSGISCFYTAIWDRISTFRGVTPLLIDLVERPEYVHRMVELLTSFEETRLQQYEDLGLLDAEQTSLHCTCALTSDLPAKPSDDTSVTRRDIWGRGMAQIFASVSAKMRDEFDIEYMKRTIGTCGLSYYGCCEPLDTMIDIVEKLPNLRKIGVTPWADARVACEAIAGRYVASAKPNPAAVAVPMLNKEHLRQELSYIIKACRDFGCSCDITLKDISTCHRRPQNIFEWEQVAMELALNA